jgi:hypothetical protein
MRELEAKEMIVVSGGNWFTTWANTCGAIYGYGYGLAYNYFSSLSSQVNGSNAVQL